MARTPETPRTPKKTRNSPKATSKTYPNPPILEAVCQFNFDSSSSWDPAVPGLIYEQIRHTFGKRRKVQLHQLMFAVDASDGLKQQQQTVVRERAQFLRDDEHVFVQVDEHMLSVNHVKPYSSWLELFPLIQKAYEAYVSVAEPKGIQRIGLRYINEIAISVPQLEPSEYFNFRPEITPALPQQVASFMLATTFLFNDARDCANVKIASKRADDKTLFLLDIDYSLARPEIPITSKQLVYEWVAEAHTSVEDVFEGALTAKTKKLFE